MEQIEILKVIAQLGVSGVLGIGCWALWTRLKERENRLDSICDRLIAAVEEDRGE